MFEFRDVALDRVAQGSHLRDGGLRFALDDAVTDVGVAQSRAETDNISEARWSLSRPRASLASSRRARSRAWVTSSLRSRFSSTEAARAVCISWRNPRIFLTSFFNYKEVEVEEGTRG